MLPSLLFIEDNEDILLNLFKWFEVKGHACDCARNGVAGLEQIMNDRPDCVVLDIMLPGMNGIEVCKAVRRQGNPVPIIMLTAKDSLENKIEGFDSGADDYLVKPFSLKELEARIKSICRRKGPEKCIHVFGPIKLDKNGHKVFRDGLELHLSPASFKILEALLAEAPDLVPRERLENLLWADEAPEGSALRNHIHELRKVLDKPFSASFIETVPRLGWRLRLPDA